MKLIVIEGATSSGKSALARKLTKDLHTKSFLKDDYKEHRFNLLKKPPTLKQWREIEAASWQEMYKVIEEAVRNDETLIIEGNFLRLSHQSKIKKLLPSDAAIVEIFCYTNGRTMLKRYIKRNRSGERHSGHRDHLSYPFVALEAMFASFEPFTRPLKLTSNIIKIDTTNFSDLNYSTVRQFVEAIS